MRRKTIIKSSRYFDIAHLYEHIYCIALTRLFRRRGLFKYIDYYYAARTYTAGIIHVDIWLYSPAAVALAPQLPSIRLAFDDQSITAAAVQVATENQSKVEGDITSLRAILEALDAEEWQAIDDFRLLDSDAVRRSRKSFWFIETSKSNFRRMQWGIQLDATLARQQRQLLPLFHVVCDALLGNLVEDLGDNKYYYCYGSMASYTNKSVSEARKLRMYVGQDLSLVDELAACRTLLTQMLDAGFILKLAHGLQHVSYQTPMLVPDEFEVFETTKVFVGGAGWESIGTESNISQVLRHATVSLTTSKVRRSFEVDELMQSYARPTAA
jgi:hypothetical protein